MSRHYVLKCTGLYILGTIDRMFRGKNWYAYTIICNHICTNLIVVFGYFSWSNNGTWPVGSTWFNDDLNFLRPWASHSSIKVRWSREELEDIDQWFYFLVCCSMSPCFFPDLWYWYIVQSFWIDMLFDLQSLSRWFIWFWHCSWCCLWVILIQSFPLVFNDAMILGNSSTGHWK